MNAKVDRNRNVCTTVAAITVPLIQKGAGRAPNSQTLGLLTGPSNAGPRDRDWLRLTCLPH